jgi:hypothetical protein
MHCSKDSNQMVVKKDSDFMNDKSSGPGVPDFNWYKIPKRAKICITNDDKISKIDQLSVKWTKWP